MSRLAPIEPLEARIAPAVIVNPLPDIIVGAGVPSTDVPLSHLFDSLVQFPGHTLVTIELNVDSDLSTPGLQPSKIVIELFDDEAPLTVQNFLRYAENTDSKADFVNTFFHRSVDNFVLQGGGFNSEKLGQHVDVFSNVHNEFSPTRSNLTGTLAMAKSVGANSATSEWFINLNDNSENLDNQNGGFTVFGQVVEGMDVVNKIADLPTINGGGAFSNLPVQNYNSNPDNNPNTPSPVPKPANLVQITKVDVERPHERVGLTEGITFTATVEGAETGEPANAVTATIANQVLKLTYNGTSTIVNVTVTATESGGVPVTEVFQVKVRPNLVGNLTAADFEPIVLPGEKSEGTITIHNNGGANFSGTVDIKFYLSPETQTDLEGIIHDADDILLSDLTLLNQTITLASGGETVLKTTLNVPKGLFELDGILYNVIATIEPSSPEASPEELFTDDKTAVDGGRHLLANGFGDLRFDVRPLTAPANSQALTFIRNDSTLTYQEADGNLVSLFFKGAGAGRASLADGNVNLDITGTDSKTQLKTKVTGTSAQINNIEIANTIGKVLFGQVDTTGYITASGGLKSLALGDVSGDRSLVIGFFPPLNTQKASLSFGTVSDLTIESVQALGRISAESWTDTVGADDGIFAPSLNSLKIAGDFEANIGLEGRAKLSSVTVEGTMRNATVTTNGDVGTVKLGKMIGSNLFVGTEARPTDLGDFVQERTIKSFTILDTSEAFADSQVAASKIGKIIVRGVVLENGDTDFGFLADSIKRYERVGSGDPKKNLNSPMTIDSPADSEYGVVIL